MDFFLPIPLTIQEAHDHAVGLSDQGQHLEAALRYLMVAGTLGNAEMEKAGVDQESRQAFLSATILTILEIRKAMGQKARLN